MVVVGRHIRVVHLPMIFLCIIISVLVFSQLLCGCLEFFCIILAVFNWWVFVGSGGTLWWMDRRVRGSPAKLHWLCKYAKPKLFILTSNHCKQKCIVALYRIVAKKVLRLPTCPSPQAHYCATFSVIWMDRYEHMNIDMDMICMKYKQYRGPNTGNKYYFASNSLQ